MTALTKIKPADLKSSQTTIEDAITMCKEVMTVILKCQDLKFTEKEREDFGNALKALGCAKVEEASQKFQPLNDATVGEILNKKNNVQFPVWTFTILTDCRESFYYGLAKITDGGRENSDIAVWLNAQEKTTFPETSFEKK